MGQSNTGNRNHWLPLLIFLALVIGFLTGFELYKYVGQKRPITTVVERNDRIEELIDLVNERYVDSVSSDSLYKDAIDGILFHLDPHTVYIPASQAKQANANLDGKFKGVGIELFKINDTMTVSRVVRNSPAEKSGIRLGDRIIEIDSTRVVDKSIDLESMRKLLSNDAPRVSLTLIHPGGNMPKRILINKGAVPLYSVPVAYMADQQTGYIKIDRFSAMTYREFMKAMELLVAEGMKKVVLDLRGNPGGYVDAATAIAGEFLGGKRLVVYTDGRKEGRENYYADQEGQFTNTEIVVMVDAGTASAAEILSGAVQDWDRGLIIGQRTFGKGLVQQQFELDDGALLRLTIARYFTPSGRSIQRSYKNGRTAYLQDYYERLYHPDSTITETGNGDGTANGAKEKVFYSLMDHRPLFGGGGIEPDVVFHNGLPFSEQKMLFIQNSNWMREIVLEYYVRNYSKLSGFHSWQSLKLDPMAYNALLDSLRGRVEAANPEVAFELWQNPLALDYLRVQLKGQMIFLMFDENAYYQFTNLQDPEFKRAFNLLQKLKKSVVKNRKAA